MYEVVRSLYANREGRTGRKNVTSETNLTRVISQPPFLRRPAFIEYRGQFDHLIPTYSGIASSRPRLDYAEFRCCLNYVLTSCCGGVGMYFRSITSDQALEDRPFYSPPSTRASESYHWEALEYPPRIGRVPAVCTLLIEPAYAGRLVLR